MSNIDIYNQDIIEFLKSYSGSKFHSVLADVPYGISFMGKSWDKYTPLEYQNWCTQWGTELIKHLYPGSVCMFFGGTRTYHRLATGLEDAGFEIFDSMIWCYGSGFPKSYNIGKNSNPNWNSYGTALKPAFEPIVLCRKPRGKETFVDCALNYGSGSLNVDGTRIGNDLIQTMPKNHFDSPQSNLGKTGYSGTDGNYHLGRFPANLGLICDCECEPCECDYKTIGDSSRFFYTAKSSRKERNLGLDHLPDNTDIRINAPRNSEDEKYSETKNNHPTVKPIKLIEYLATMIKPPIENSSILIPFSGSGSEIIGAMLAGWNNITGIEIDESYCNIANNRVDYWKQFDSYEKAMKG